MSELEKVYVVMYEYWDHAELIGIYTTRERAEARARAGGGFGAYEVYERTLNERWEAARGH